MDEMDMKMSMGVFAGYFPEAPYFKQIFNFNNPIDSSGQFRYFISEN